MKIIFTCLLSLVTLPSIIVSIPSNDLPCDATEIDATNLPICISTTTLGTTFELIDGTTPAYPGGGAGLDCTGPHIDTWSTGGSVWFRVIGPFTDLIVSACSELYPGASADFDTRISVFQPPTNCSDYTSFVCVDPGNAGSDDAGGCTGFTSHVTVTGPHPELYVHFHGFGSSEGNADLCFAGAESITPIPTTVTPTTSIPTTSTPTTSIPTTSTPTTSIPTTYPTINPTKPTNYPSIAPSVSSDSVESEESDEFGEDAHALLALEAQDNDMHMNDVKHYYVINDSILIPVVFAALTICNVFVWGIYFYKRNDYKRN